MLDANNKPISVGDTVILVSHPTGALSSSSPLTVGAEYKVMDIFGSNVVTTCDEPGCLVGYYGGRVAVVSK